MKLELNMNLLRKVNETYNSTFVEFDAINAEDMIKEVEETSRWKWALPSLQRYVDGFGPERSVLVFARSNGGKTSFITSQAVHFMRQGAKVLHFSISEDTKFKLNERYIQAAYNIHSGEFLEDVHMWVDRFNEDFANKLAIRNVSSLSIREAEAAISAFEPDIVVYDQYQKVAVSSKVEMRSDEHLTLIVQKLKALSKDYRHGIICGTQASSSAELNNFTEPKPKKWLTQLDVAGSKSGVPGEFQTMLGIGQDIAGLQPAIDENGTTHQCYARYISMPKNKGEMGNFVVYLEPFRNKWVEYGNI
jgi:replicative DNA helicase